MAPAGEAHRDDAAAAAPAWTAARGRPSSGTIRSVRHSCCAANYSRYSRRLWAAALLLQGGRAAFASFESRRLRPANSYIPGTLPPWDRKDRAPPGASREPGRGTRRGRGAAARLRVPSLGTLAAEPVLGNNSRWRMTRTYHHDGPRIRLPRVDSNSSGGLGRGRDRRVCQHET